MQNKLESGLNQFSPQRIKFKKSPPDDKSKIDGFKRSEVWAMAIAEICGSIDSHPSLEMVVLPEVGNPDKELLRMTLLADGYRVNELGSSLVAMWNKKDIIKRRYLK